MQVSANQNIFRARAAKLATEHGEEDGRQRVSDPYITELKARWAAMSQEEREEYRDGVEALTARRENKAQGIQNVALTAFHDAQRTLAVIQREVSNDTFIIASHTNGLLFLARIPVRAHRGREPPGRGARVRGVLRRALRLRRDQSHRRVYVTRVRHLPPELRRAP